MSENKKNESCSSGCGCGCCSPVKKVIVVIVLMLVVFTCGYIYGKGGCPLSSTSSKMCPLPVR